MRRSSLLVGISVLTTLTATVSAQTGPNSRAVSCAAENLCTVSDAGYGNERNSVVVTVSGKANEAALFVSGDDNRSFVQIDGDGNRVAQTHYGDGHHSNAALAGSGSRIDIWQAARLNSATLKQTGTSNQIFVQQGTREFEYGGERNIVSVDQLGSALRSEVFQKEETLARFKAPSSGNQATIVQRGLGSDSLVRQINRGNAALVFLFGGGVDPDANGATGTPLNVSDVHQENSIYTQDASGAFLTGQGGASPANNPITANLADVSITGQQNMSAIRQNGVRNKASASILSGGTGVSARIIGPSGRLVLAAGKPEGNQSRISQFGRDLSASVSSGGLGGKGNLSEINQGGDLASDGSWIPGHNHEAMVWQRGLFDYLGIHQNDNARGGAAQNSVQSGSLADVSQISFNSRVGIHQYGTNSAAVSQARNGDGSGGDLVISVSQVDSGDVASDGLVSPGQNIARVSQAGIGNIIGITQRAINADATVWQKRGSQDGSASLLQGSGSSSINLTATLHQEGKSTSAILDQDGRNHSAEVHQASTALVPALVELRANVRQRGESSSANVRQTGSLLTASVDQQGVGAAGRRHSVSVEQEGDRHSAIVAQAPEVRVSDHTAPSAGSAGVPFARSAGSYSAEAVILQSGARGTADIESAGNRAQVEQRGAGQYARIEQNGRGNKAGILQNAGATNAVAVIEQKGDGNIYFVVQDAPGQYLRVQQNGTGNSVTVRFGSPNAPGGLSGGEGGTTDPFSR